MKRLSFVFLIAVTGSILMVSCKQGDKSTLQVPIDAGFVLHVNNTSLSTKLSWDEIKATKWFKEVSAESTDTLFARLLENPENSGMDTKADMIAYMKKQSKSGYFAFGGSLKDPAAFELFNKKMNDGEGVVTKDGETNFMTLKEKGIVAWKGTRFVYIIDAPMGGTMYPPLTGASNPSEPYKFPLDSLKAFGKASFDINGKNSLGSDDRFAELMKEPGDVHMWVNSEQYLSSLGGDMLGMMKVGDLFKGNASAITMSFDNGKIVFKSKQYLNEQLASLYKKYPPKKISADVINRIPSQNVAGVFALNYSPEGLKELIKLTGFDGFTNEFLAKAGYSIDEFVKANKGDLIVAISDFQVKKKDVIIPGYEGSEPTTYSTTQPDVKFLFATSVNDKAAFDKLINTLSQQLGNEKPVPDLTYQINKDWFVAGNSTDYVTKFLAGPSTKQAFADKLSGQSFGAFIDLQIIIKGTQSEASSVEDKAMADASLKMWQDVLMTSGGELKNGVANSLVEINLVDKSVNSLKQLNQYIDAMSIHRKKKMPGTDDVIVEPVAPPVAEPKN
ncbi:MAG: DUF4836 family protein [Chitinophagaceae bacterium]|nr:DUF4836 family protein [Chitinophagaceae bacterium]